MKALPGPPTVRLSQAEVRYADFTGDSCFCTADTSQQSQHYQQQVDPNRPVKEFENCSNFNSLQDFPPETS